MKTLNLIALTLTIIGAINWGLIGLFNFNLVSFLFGDMTLLSRIIYSLVGLAGLYLITFYGLLSEKETAQQSLFLNTNHYILFFKHTRYLAFTLKIAKRLPRKSSEALKYYSVDTIKDYSMIVATLPDPTVLPPSRYMNSVFRCIFHTFYG